MDVVVTGSSGLIGSALVPALWEAGHTVRRLVRRSPSAPDEVRWDPEAGTIDAEGLAGVGAAVHLAGEGIAEKRWTPEQKRRLAESRTTGTRLLAETLAALDPKPSVLLSGSAMGFYGNGGEAILTEDSPRGTGFLPDLVEAWEAAAQPAIDAGIRTAYLRTGIVLSPDGGAMGKTLLLFKLGLGGPVGNGKPWWSWITLEDEVHAIVHLLTADVSGPVNLTAPNPVRNRDYARAQGKALHRPAFLPTPTFAPKLVLGSELANSLLGDSLRILPTRLLASGYEFRHPEIGEAMEAMLG
ncbi:MAG: hypothetical protein JWO68_3759 [Actinomycetia bacterium]|nr:hypothetical protein [Actinomycetes bacterium]